MEVKKYAKNKLAVKDLRGGMQYKALTDLDFSPVPYIDLYGLPKIIIKEGEIITLLERPCGKRGNQCTAKILTQDGEIGYLKYSVFKKFNKYIGKIVDIKGKNLEFNWDVKYNPGKPLHQ